MFPCPLSLPLSLLSLLYVPNHFLLHAVGRRRCRSFREAPALPAWQVRHRRPCGDAPTVRGADKGGKTKTRGCDTLWRCWSGISQENGKIRLRYNSIYFSSEEFNGGALESSVISARGFLNTCRFSVLLLVILI